MINPKGNIEFIKTMNEIYYPITVVNNYLY